MEDTRCPTESPVHLIAAGGDSLLVQLQDARCFKYKGAILVLNLMLFFSFQNFYLKKQIYQSIDLKRGDGIIKESILHKHIG